MSERPSHHAGSSLEWQQAITRIDRTDATQIDWLANKSHNMCAYYDLPGSGRIEVSTNDLRDANLSPVQVKKLDAWGHVWASSQQVIAGETTQKHTFVPPDPLDPSDWIDIHKLKSRLSTEAPLDTHIMIAPFAPPHYDITICRFDTAHTYLELNQGRPLDLARSNGVALVKIDVRTRVHSADLRSRIKERGVLWPYPIYDRIEQGKEFLLTDHEVLSALGSFLDILPRNEDGDCPLYCEGALVEKRGTLSPWYYDIRFDISKT